MDERFTTMQTTASKVTALESASSSSSSTAMDTSASTVAMGMPTTIESIIERNNDGVKCFHRGKMREAQAIFYESVQMICAYSHVLASAKEEDFRNHPAMAPCYCFAVSSVDDITLSSKARRSMNMTSRDSGCYLFHSPFKCYDYRDYSSRQYGFTHFLNNAKRLKAITVFNLGLTYQMIHGASHEAICLYNFVFHNYDCVDVLGAATINNSAIWCLENDNYIYARYFLYYLFDWLAVSERMVGPIDVQGFLTNVTVLFMQPPSTSPAA
jgi:hypothetical protein